MLRKIRSLWVVALFLFLRKRERKVKPEYDYPEGSAPWGTLYQKVPKPSQAYFGEVEPLKTVKKRPIFETAPVPQLTLTQSKPLVNCPKCENPFSIDTSSVPYKMECPHCGLKGLVERK